MKRVACTLIGFLIATPSFAQEEVISGPGQRLQVTRTMELPGQIGFAFDGYLRCLSETIDAVMGDDPSLLESAETKTRVLNNCRAERERTIFLSATALERQSELDIDQRQQMISDALESFEQFVMTGLKPPAIPSDFFE